MAKGKPIDYVDWVKQHQTYLGYEFIDFKDEIFTVKCLKCGAVKTYKKESIYTNYKNAKPNSFHTSSCAKYFNDLIRDELGEKLLNKFRGYYRYSRERCCNPNCKDYAKYKGMFKFEDFIHYYKHCYDLFKESINKYGTDCVLSMDRIENNKGYEPNNVRFVPMGVNLQNKDIVIPVMCVDLETKDIYEAVSIGEMAKKYFDGENSISSIHRSIKSNGIYKNRYKIFYTLRTNNR